MKFYFVILILYLYFGDGKILAFKMDFFLVLLMLYFCFGAGKILALIMDAFPAKLMLHFYFGVEKLFGVRFYFVFGNLNFESGFMVFFFFVTLMLYLCFEFINHSSCIGLMLFFSCNIHAAFLLCLKVIDLKAIFFFLTDYAISPWYVKNFSFKSGFNVYFLSF